MALSELQDWIMRELAAKQGLIEDLLERPEVGGEAMEQAIDGLVKRRYVTVIGPPNGNSFMGKDVDELRLAPFGISYLRTLRPTR